MVDHLSKVKLVSNSCAFYYKRDAKEAHICRRCFILGRNIAHSHHMYSVGHVHQVSSKAPASGYASNQVRVLCDGYVSTTDATQVYSSFPAILRRRVDLDVP